MNAFFRYMVSSLCWTIRRLNMVACIIAILCHTVCTGWSVVIHRAGPFTVKRRSRDTPNDANVDTAFNILPLNQPSDQHTTCESKTLIEPRNREVYKMETWVKLLLINHFLPRWPHKPDLRGDFNRTVALNALLQSDSNTNFQKHKAL